MFTIFEKRLARRVERPDGVLLMLVTAGQYDDHDFMRLDVDDRPWRKLTPGISQLG